MLANLKSIKSIIATSITASIIILANSVVSQATGLQNSASLAFFSDAAWVEDANATTPPDYGYLYPDEDAAACYKSFFCDTPPCGQSLDETGLIASKRSCNMTGPIQNVLNKMYGNNSYVAIEAYADSSCSDLLSVPRWNGGFAARFYRAEGCYKFDPSRSFQFYPYSSSIGSVKAVYYLNPTCSGSSPIPIYGNQDIAFVPKEQVSSTGCFNATVFLKPYNITAETGVQYPFARFYTSYSVGGNKYGQTPVSAQTAATTTKASSSGNNTPSSARSLNAPPSIFLVFAAVFAFLSL